MLRSKMVTAADMAILLLVMQLGLASRCETYSCATIVAPTGLTWDVEYIDSKGGLV